jgi:hypothetical protein
MLKRYLLERRAKRRTPYFGGDITKYVVALRGQLETAKDMDTYNQVLDMAHQVAEEKWFKIECLFLNDETFELIKSTNRLNEIYKIKKR